MARRQPPTIPSVLGDRDAMSAMNPAALGAVPHDRPLSGRLNAYFWSDNRRRVQTVLGLIWLIDGGLQFQSVFYGNGFKQLLDSAAQGQPGWLHDSIIWGAKIASSNFGVWNTLFALTQVAIGFGLLYRPLIKPALVLSFGWALVVWWFGNGFGGMLLATAQPMTGAPSAVLLYALIGLVIWPGDRPGGLLGARGARIQWAGLWLVMAFLWLTASSSAPDATSGMLTSTGSGISVITSLQNHLASATRGGGVPIAFGLALLSAAIAVAVVRGWQARTFLWISIGLNLLYWVIPQGLGGVFAGGATDVDTGPLFILLAVAMFPLLTSEVTAPTGYESTSRA
jgi:hypothetical protein